MSWTLHPVSDFDAFADRWTALNAASIASPLLEVEFVGPLLREFASGKERLVCYERDGHVLALGVLTPAKAGVWTTLNPSQAPMSMWLCHRSADEARLVQELMQLLPGVSLLLGITQRDPQLEPRPADTGAIHTMDYVQTARISIQGSFDDYWAARGKNLRTNLKKQRGKLAKDGINARMEIVTAPDAMAKAVEDYGRLESAGWKARGGTAIHPDNAQGRFYRAMLEGFARRGAASVFRYWFDDEIVAMNLCIEGNGVLIVLKTTYQENLPAHYSPAFLLREDTCHLLFTERKYHTLEFYGKLMEWHLRWTDEVRTMYHVNHYRWPALLGLHQLAKNGAGALARLRRPAAKPETTTTEQE